MEHKLNHINNLEKESYVMTINKDDYYRDDMTDEERKELDEIFNNLRKYAVKNEE